MSASWLRKKLKAQAMVLILVKLENGVGRLEY